MSVVFRQGRPAELSGGTVYAILKLRVDVFVVEQDCAYPELDGRDLEPDTLWFWAEDSENGTIAATLRLLLDDGGVRRIGRVATATSHRGAGLAADLMQRAVAASGDATVVLEAQARLSGWYERFGFAVTGAEYLEDGIPHVPMTRQNATDRHSA